jgi:hypothetical protein
MDALRRKDGPQGKKKREGKREKYTDGKTYWRLFFPFAGTEWMGPITNLETCVALVVTLSSRCHEQRGRQIYRLLTKLTSVRYRSWLRHYATTSRKVAGSIRDAIGFFFQLI